METLFANVLVELLAVLAGAALLRLLAWLRERAAVAPEVASTY